MKKVILLLGIICGITHGKAIQRTYNDEATRKLQALVEKVELWAGVAKPEFLNEVEKLILEGANPNVKDQLDMPLTTLLIRTSQPLSLILFPVDIPMLEKTFKIVLDHGAIVNELISSRFFLDHLADAPPTMIQMFLDHMPLKNRIQQEYKQEVKNEIIKSVKKSLEFETEKVAMHKRNNVEHAREKNIDPQVQSALTRELEKSQKEVDRLRKTLEALEGPATNIQPKVSIDAKEGIRTNPIPQ